MNTYRGIPKQIEHWIIKSWNLLKIGLYLSRIWLKNMKSEIVFRTDKFDTIYLLTRQLLTYCDFLSLDKNIWSLWGCKSHSKRLGWITVCIFVISQNSKIQICNQILTPVNTSQNLKNPVNTFLQIYILLSIYKSSRMKFTAPEISNIFCRISKSFRYHIFEPCYWCKPIFNVDEKFMHYMTSAYDLSILFFITFNWSILELLYNHINITKGISNINR